MKRKTRITAITAAAALLALGASFTSMAAQTGTWRMENGEWYCYDKNGDAFEDEFCLSNGKEFYVGEDGRMVRSSWVEYEGYWYYVNSAGQKSTNEWRYTVPAEDEDGEPQWYYLQSGGKRAEGKKLTIGGKTYYFDAEGVMLTGWIQGAEGEWSEATEANVSETTTYYCDENGARVSANWVYTYAPGIDDEEADEEEKNWYYIMASGKPAIGKQNNIKGETYFFGTDGAMLSGWVAGNDDVYREIWTEDGAGTAVSTAAESGLEIYFCGSKNDGHAKKSKWIKEWSSVDYGYGDSDNDKNWYYLQNNGKLFVPQATETATLSNAQKYTLVDVAASINNRFEADEAQKTQEKKINNKTYLFNQDGEMVYGFVKMDDKMYYYGGADDGARKSGSVTVTDEEGESTSAFFASETNTAQGYYNGAGVNGAKNGKLYADGVLVKALDDKYEIKTVADMQFVVNKSGNIQTSKGPYKYDGEELFGGAKFTYNTDTKGVAYESIATMN